MLDPGPESWILFWVAMAMVAEDVVTIGGLTFPLRQMAAPWRWEFQWGVVKTIIITLWLFNIAMENSPLIDSLPGFTYLKW